MRSKWVTALLAAAALAGCGSAGGPEVGKCTNSDPDLGVELDVQIVDCDDDDATTKIVKEAENRADCESGTLRSEDHDKIFCTEPLGK
jgi:hypothetical protein